VVDVRKPALGGKLGVAVQPEYGRALGLSDAGAGLVQPEPASFHWQRC
jgi:hypothetical protein